MQVGSSFLARSFYGNSVVDWVAALAVAAGSMVLIWAVGRLLLRRLTALTGRTATDVDDLVAELLAKTKFLFVLLVGIWVGSRTLSLSSTGRDRLEEIPETVRSVVEAREKTRFDRSHFKEFGDSALVVETVHYMLVPDFHVYMDTRQAINLELYRRFEDAGIDFAFPTRTVHVEQSNG